MESTDELRQRFKQETIIDLYKAQIEKLIKDNAKLRLQLEESQAMSSVDRERTSQKRSADESRGNARDDPPKRWRESYESDGQSSNRVEVGARWNKYTPNDHKEYAEYISKGRLCMYDLTSHYRISSISKRTGEQFQLYCKVKHENPNVLHVKDLKMRGTKYSKHAALCLVTDQFGYDSRDHQLAKRLCDCILEDRDEMFSADVAPFM